MADTIEDVADTTAGRTSTLDKLTKTTADERADLIAKAQGTLTDAVDSVVGAVKANPKTAAAIAAGATAAVAGAAYGATKLVKAKGTKASAATKSTTGKATAAKRTTATKRAPAKRTTTAKS